MREWWITEHELDRPGEAQEYLLQEDEEEMIFELLMASAFALATLRRFGGTDGYSDEPRFLPEFRAERDGFRSTDQLRSPYRHLGIQQ